MVVGIALKVVSIVGMAAPPAPGGRWPLGVITRERTSSPRWTMALRNSLFETVPSPSSCPRR
eukprot:scaffold75854_cov39-Phaeocystis_antarctica.AAC.2